MASHMLSTQAVLPHERSYQLHQGDTLRGRPGVRGSSCKVIQATYVTDADACLVSPLAMCALLRHRATAKNLACLVNYEMITYILPSVFHAVPAFYIVKRNRLRGESTGAMEYYFIY